MTTWWLLIGALSVAFLTDDVSGCSCMYSHPQEHYCSADFVAVVKVKSKGKGDGTTTAYHVKVKKEFKVSDKARHALSQGLLWTSSYDSTCGVSLRPTRYLISGHIRGEKPWISLCNFVEEWPKLSSKQKKGFRKLYQQGCPCRVRMSRYVGPYGPSQHKRERYCSWDVLYPGHQEDCQALYSLCVPSAQNSELCTWVSSSQYRRCVKERKLERERQRELEP